MENRVEVVQVSKINIEKSFIFKDDGNIGFPMEPLISAEFLEPNIIKVRIVVFIDKNNKNDPSVEIVSEVDDALHVSICYNHGEIVPLEYNSYYLEINYTSDTVSKIKKVDAKLIDIDPKTSRGTVTEVAH